MTYLFMLWGFPLEYSLASLAYLIPLHKKRGWRLHTLLIVGAQIASHYVFLWFHVQRVGIMFLAFLASFLLGILLFWVCAKGTIWDAIFGACCGYATQHLSYVLHDVLITLCPTAREPVSTVLILVVTCLCCYLCFGRRLPISGEYRVGWREAVRSLIIVIPFAYLLSMLVSQVYMVGENLKLYLICRVYAMFCCVFALWIQTSMNEKVSIETEYRTQQQLWKMQREQYQISKENIDIINRKCHDLKYQVAALRQEQSERKRSESLDAIENSVLIYDSIASTGNEVLDTILTERSLNCEKEHISWTCVAEGSKLSFIDPVDSYILFGNILDNAIESVRKLEDPAKRVVSTNIYTRKNMAVIQVENYYSGTIELEKGLPKTTKEDSDSHGFGMQSIKKITEKYGGSISIDTDGQIFLLSILLPLDK